MTVESDIARVLEQERALVFTGFDEATAFAIGSAIRARGVAEKLTLVVDVRLWDRPLFYAALPGTNGDNPDWVRRKSNSVRRFSRSTYRIVLERNFEERVFPPHRALEATEYAIAGGGFPVTIKGVGVVGAITVSGLSERDDHGVVVAAVAQHLGLDAAALALPPA